MDFFRPRSWTVSIFNSPRTPNVQSKPLRFPVGTLVKHGIGAVITDKAGWTDCVHMQLTVPKAFIRFVGNNLHASDYTRIDKWSHRLKQWLDNGLQEVYFFMHHPIEEFSPELSEYAAKQLNEHCNANLIRPWFLE